MTYEVPGKGSAQVVSVSSRGPMFRDRISNNTPAHHTRTISVLSAAFTNSKSLASCVTFPVPTLLKVLTATAHLLAVSILTLLPLLHGFLNWIHHPFKNKEMRRPLPAAKPPLQDRHAPHLTRQKVHIHRTRHLPREIM